MLDDLDIGIANALQTNARQSSEQLSAKLGVSPSTIRRRISKLTKENVLRIVALPNPISMGFDVWALLGLTVSIGKHEEVANHLLRYPECYSVSLCLGRYDITVSVSFRTNEQLTEFVTNELAKISGIEACETILLSHPRKYYDFIWPETEQQHHEAGDKPTGKSNNGSSHVILDQLDQLIVEQLHINASVTSAELAKKLSVSSSNVRQRMAKLIKQNAIRIIALPNPLSMGHTVWANIGMKVTLGCAQKVADALLKYPTCYSSIISLGRFDIIAGVRFTSNEELTDFITTELPKIQGIVRTETMLFTRPYKYYNFIWP